MEIVKVSTMSGKLKGLQAINTSPLTNPYCMSIAHGVCDYCYAKHFLSTCRKTCEPAWAENGRILSTTSDFMLSEPITKTYVRFHAYGELFNELHYRNFCMIADSFKESRFALWTKRPELCIGTKPANLKLIYSVPEIDGMHAIPEGFDTSFLVTTEGPWNCEGACFDCLKCYRGEERVTAKLTRRK